MNIDEISQKYEKIFKNIKLDHIPFDIVRDPITDFLYDKTVSSDIFKAKRKRAIIETMKFYRTDLDIGWEKYLTKMIQSKYKNQAQQHFKQNSLESIQLLTLAEWGNQLNIESIENIFEPRNFTSFSFSFWNDFEAIYQERESLYSAFSQYGLCSSSNIFLSEAYSFISNNTRGRSKYNNENNQ